MTDKHQQKPPQTTDLIFAFFFLITVASGTAWFVYIIDERFAVALAEHLIRLARGAGN